MNPKDFGLFCKLAASYDFVFWAGAQIDFRVGTQELHRLNFTIVKDAIDKCHNVNAGVRFVTFGSAFEELSNLDSNHYLQSKKALANWIISRDYGNVLHIRTHSLLDDLPPPPFMLLGQLLDALQSGREFVLGSPSAFRQYFTFDDFAQASLETALAAEYLESRIVQIGGAVPVRLGELVECAIQHFNPSVTMRISNSQSWQSSESDVHGDSVLLRVPDSLDAAMSHLQVWLDSR